MTKLMTILIAACKNDLAATTIGNKLIEKYSFVETEKRSNGLPIYQNGDLLFAYLDRDDIYADNLDQRLQAEAIIFASRHRSESQEPTLTTHVSGNLTSEARFGGMPKRLALSHPNMMKAALLSLMHSREALRLDQYQVSLEATHHGPTELQTPSLFLEIGSSEKQWRDESAGEAVADAIYACATKPASGEVSVGFGGGHYSPKLTKVDLEEDFSIGHILPKYFFDTFDPSMVRLAFERTFGNCTNAIIDWKGVRGPERKELVKLLEGLGKRIMRV